MQRVACLAVLVSGVLAFSAGAEAQEQKSAPQGPRFSYYQADVPLMTIRFNQQNVYFERPLYTVVKRAVDVKPDVVFDLQAEAPQSSSRDQSAIAARQSLGRVINAMQEIGVPKQQMRSKIVPGKAEYPVVNIFVY